MEKLGGILIIGIFYLLCFYVYFNLFMGLPKGLLIIIIFSMIVGIFYYGNNKSFKI